MASTKVMKREFYFEAKKISLTDPDPNMDPDEVLEFYSNTYPELTNAVCAGPELNDEKAKFTFKSNVGTKG